MKVLLLGRDFKVDRNALLLCMLCFAFMAISFLRRKDMVSLLVLCID